MAKLDLTNERLTFLVSEKQILTPDRDELVKEGAVIALKHRSWYEGGSDDAIQEMFINHPKRGILTVRSKSQAAYLLPKYFRRATPDELVPHAFCAFFGILPNGQTPEAGDVMQATSDLTLKKGIQILAGTHIKCVKRATGSKHPISAMLRDANNRPLRCQINPDAFSEMRYKGHARKWLTDELGRAHMEFQTTRSPRNEGTFIVRSRNGGYSFEPGAYAGSVRFITPEGRRVVESCLHDMLTNSTHSFSSAELALVNQYPPSAEDYLEYRSTTQGIEDFGQFMLHLYRDSGFKVA